jgi:hypothetical protein
MLGENVSGQYVEVRDRHFTVIIVSGYHYGRVLQIIINRSNLVLLIERDSPYSPMGHASLIASVSHLLMCKDQVAT